MSEPKLTDARLKELIRIREDESCALGPLDDIDVLRALKELEKLKKAEGS